MTFMGGTATYIQIIRTLEDPSQQDDLSLDLIRGLSISGNSSDTVPMADEEMLYSEDADQVSLARPRLLSSVLPN